MKNSILKSLMVTILITIHVSCSSDSSDTSILIPEPITENTWILNDFNFWRSNLAQIVST